MSDDKLTPERAVRLLRAKAGELEAMAPHYIESIRVVNPSSTAQDVRALYEMGGNLMADIALIAILLADHIERMEPVRQYAIDTATIANFLADDRNNPP